MFEGVRGLPRQEPLGEDVGWPSMNPWRSMISWHLLAWALALLPTGPAVELQSRVGMRSR
jgi:hypothetical protein